MVGYGLEGALKFGFYEAFKILFILVTSNKFIKSLLASVVAGAIASIVLVSIFGLLHTSNSKIYQYCICKHMINNYYLYTYYIYICIYICLYAYYS